MFGQRLQQNELLKEQPKVFNTEIEYMIDFRNHLKNIHMKYLERRKLNIERQSREVNKNRVHRFFKPGDLVTLRQFELAEISGGATMSKYIGPYLIDSINIRENTCILMNMKMAEKEEHILCILDCINLMILIFQFQSDKIFS